MKVRKMSEGEPITGLCFKLSGANISCRDSAISEGAEGYVAPYLSGEEWYVLETQPDEEKEMSVQDFADAAKVLADALNFTNKGPYEG